MWVRVGNLSFRCSSVMTRNPMLSFYRCTHKLLRGLLELLFGSLRVRVGRTCGLILNLDVNGLSVGSSCHLLLLLLRLSRLVASIHCIIHHAPTIEGIVSLLLIFGARNYRATDYAESTTILGLALLLKLGSSLYRTCHSLIICGDISG